jgi:hypothetical protein
MLIIANNQLLKFLKKISIFKVDLGFNLKGAPSKKGPNKIKIKDEFIKKYENMTGKVISKYGDIGKILFYEDSTIKDEYYIFEDDKIYEISYTYDELIGDPAEYLASILRDIDEQKTTNHDNIEIMKNVSYTNLPEDIDTPDITLPKEQYIDALIKRRAIINEQPD